MPLPSMMLGYTGERGNTLKEVTDCLKKGSRSDSTSPTGTVYFAVNDDIRSTCREWQFHGVELALTRNRVKNYNIAVREWNDTIIFLHKLMKGGTSRSYGIQVAALAGVPPLVVERAKEILKNIETGEFNHQGEPRIAARKKGKNESHPNQLSLFGGGPDPIRDKLKEVKPDDLSPLDALNLLYELKKM